MTDKSKRSDQANNPSNHLDRRNLLLAGTALVAAASVGSTAAVQTAQAQQQPAAAAGRPPNILLNWLIPARSAVDSSWNMPPQS